MVIERRGRSWFDMSKAVIDDYGPTIGAPGVAVYACLARLCQAPEDGCDFELKDLGTMLRLEDSEVEQAINTLIKTGIIGRESTASGTETMTTFYLVDLASKYYGTSIDMAPQNVQPAIQPIQTKQAAARKGFVYIVEGEGYFKIGCTNDLSKRIKSLTVKAPFDLIVHLVIPSLDMYRTESVLHRRFAHKRRRGEWFNLQQGDIEDIRSEYQTLDPAFLSTE